MGIAIGELHQLLNVSGCDKLTGLKLLDIGCSNIYGGDAQVFENFLTRYGSVSKGAELTRYSELMALGARPVPVAGGVNGSWLGELLERAGCEYAAYDIFNGYKTTIFDMNKNDVLKQHEQYFDFVINCGTTEHILNQINCFKVIHDAVKVGGLIMHSLPMLGYLNHGYFNYNPLLFLDLAEANDYRVEKLTYGGPSRHQISVFAKIIEPYADRGFIDVASLKEAWQDLSLPDGGVLIVLRRTSDRPFRAPLETLTTVGGKSAVSDALLGATDFHARAKAMAADPAAHSIDDIKSLLNVFQQANMLAAFPRSLEYRLLQDITAKDPSREDLKARMKQIESLQTAQTPLIRLKPDAGTKLRPAILDGVEEKIAKIKTEDQRFNNIIGAYHEYHAAGLVERFPLALEREALERMMAEHPTDYDAVKRLGAVVAALLASTPLSSG